jgi:hypothetical protein
VCFVYSELGTNLALTSSCRMLQKIL